jgi:hypothetical protein
MMVEKVLGTQKSTRHQTKSWVNCLIDHWLQNDFHSLHPLALLIETQQKK